MHTVDDAKRSALDPAVLDMKQRFDPQGLLDPGKLRSRDTWKSS